MKNKMAKAGSLLLVISMGAGLLAGCGSSSGGGTDGAKELNICIWDGMFSEDAINDFEKKNGCKVNVTYIDNTDTMLSKLVEGGNQYDVLDIEAPPYPLWDTSRIQRMRMRSLQQMICWLG